MPDNQLQKFDQLKAVVTTAVQPIMALKVSNDEASKNALTAGREVKAYLKQVEDLRKELVAPLKEQAKRIDAYAKQIAEPLERAEGHVKKELAQWELELDRRRREELRKAEEARAKAEAEARLRADEERKANELASIFDESPEAEQKQAVIEVEAKREMVAIRQDHKATVNSINEMKVPGARKVWTFTIESLADVPREFLVLDEKAVRSAINGGRREIPGLSIFQDTRIALK